MCSVAHAVYFPPMRSLALVLIVLTLGCEKKPVTSATLKGDGFTAIVNAAPFSFKVLDSAGATLLETTGGFDPSLSQFADWDLFWRASRQGRVVTLRDTLVHYRVHRGNTPMRWAVDAAPWLHVMQKHLAALPATPSLRRARHNLLINLSLGEYWRGNRTASRAWMRQALKISLRPLGHPTHPVWSAPLLHAFLPAFAADQLIHLLGVDAYQTDRVPDSAAQP